MKKETTPISTNKRFFISVAASVAIILAIFFGYKIMTGSITVTKTAEEIQALLDENLPFSTENGSATVESAGIEIENNVLTVTNVRVFGKKWDQEFDTTISSDLRPYYRAKGFHLDAQNINIQKFSHNGNDGVDNSANKLVSGLRNKLKRYAPEKKGLHNMAEDLSPKVTEWAKTYPEKAIRAALKKIPVYRLKDDVKGFIIGAALDEDSIKIIDNKLTVTITYKRITLIIFLFVLLIVVAALFLYAAVVNPIAMEAILAPFQIFTIFGS